MVDGLTGRTQHGTSETRGFAAEAEVGIEQKERDKSDVQVARP